MEPTKQGIQIGATEKPKKFVGPIKKGTNMVFQASKDDTIIKKGSITSQMIIKEAEFIVWRPNLKRPYLEEFSNISF